MGFMSEALYESLNFSNLFLFFIENFLFGSSNDWPPILLHFVCNWVWAKAVLNKALAYSKVVKVKNGCIVRSGFAKKQKAGFYGKRLKLIRDLTLRVKVQFPTSTV